MSDQITVREAAARWGLTPRRVSALCRQGRIAGAAQVRGRWMLPADAQKPGDHRVKSGVYAKRSARRPELLPLPIGVTDFREAVSGYYYVDKTLLIRDFIDDLPKVTLFTRPRRFGKTLNMDMLRTFFEKTGEDTSVYFQNRKIWSCGEKYRAFQGRYPVIYITFKDAKLLTWKDTLNHIRFLLMNEFQRHSELAASERCSASEKAYYQKVLSGRATEGELMNALLVLSQMLDAHHGIAPVILIDEYDIPIQQGHIRGFYDEVISFMRNLFSGGLKDNRHLSYGFLTGILRVAKESIFSGMNNLSVYSVLDERFSDYFGFTDDEVRQMASYYGASDKYSDLCEWYDGYRFGDSHIFNPWSIVNYFQRKCTLQAYWVSTSSNDVIGELLSNGTKEFYEKLNLLLQGKPMLTYIDTGVVYPQIRSNPSSVYSFLLVTGYLKFITSAVSMGDGYLCEVALPNREISYVYKKEILEKLTDIIPQPAAISIQEALYTGNAEDLRDQLQSLLLQSASFHDTAGELFYHGLMLGLTAVMDDSYFVTSNREAGEGRYDIQLEPGDGRLPGILIELKAEPDAAPEKLKALAQKALQQMEDRKYDSSLRAKGIRTVLKYGVAFSGKNVAIETLTQKI